MKLAIGFEHKPEKNDLSHIKDEETKKIIESLVSYSDTFGSCGWTHYCYDCGTYFCSGCEVECPNCESVKVTFKGWNKDEINNAIKEFPTQIIYGNIFRWSYIKLWNLFHPKALVEE